MGESRVELLGSLGEETPVGSSSPSAGPGMHHVAYGVDDLPARSRPRPTEGAELIDEEPRSGLFGLQVAFVHPDAVHGVLAELVLNERERSGLRIEIGFDGGQIMSALVTAETADELERALAQRERRLRRRSTPRTAATPSRWRGSSSSSASRARAGSASETFSAG